MDNSSPAPFPTNECFTLFRFCLRPAATGGKRQSVRNLGEFAGVELAFDEARLRALAELRSGEWNDPAASAEDGESVTELFATEWGYDLKRGHHTLARFWVHARPMSFSPGSGI